MRDWGLFELGMAAFLVFTLGVSGWAWGAAVYSRVRDNDCENVCHEQHHDFSRINTAGECVCGDAVE